MVGSSYLCIIAGLVQTGSVFLQAKPEDYRCKNELDEKFNNTNFHNFAFGSTTTKSKKWDFAFDTECPEARDRTGSVTNI